MLNWLGREFWVALRGDFMKCMRYCERHIADIDRTQRQELGIANRVNARVSSPKNRTWN